MTANPVSLPSIVTHLDTLLAPHQFSDSSINGLQVDSGQHEITTVALAVDAGEAVFQAAAAAGAQLLITHHGMLWGQVAALTGAFGRKVAFLYANKLSLYAMHLPLDAHLEVGNNAELARFIGAGGIAPAFPHHGQLIGVRAALATPTPLNAIAAQLQTLPGATIPLVLPFGATTIRTIGIITGSGAMGIPEAQRLGLDLFISGEPKQSAYHEAQELGQSVIFAGHYATETVGVKKLGAILSAQFGIRPVFIDHPTGI